MARWTWILALALLAGCLQDEPAPEPSVTTTLPADASQGPFTVRSTAFAPNQPIPRKYSCDDQNVSPELKFANATQAVKTYALIMEDPDAPSGTVLHWTFWNVPANATTIPEKANIPDLGGREGRTYRGPCPPAPPAHRYFFYGYAVDSTLALESGASVADLRAALEGHTVARDQFYGTYLRVGIPLRVPNN